MPLLTELEEHFDFHFYKYSAPATLKKETEIHSTCVSFDSGGVLGSLVKECGCPFLDFFRSWIFNAGCDPPDIFRNVLHTRTAVAVKHVFRLNHGFSAGRDGFFVSGVNVGDVMVEHGRRRFPLALRLANHQQRVRNPNLGMKNRTVRPQNSRPLDAIESLLQKFNEPRGIGHGQIGRDGVTSFRNYWLSFHNLSFDRCGVCDLILFSKPILSSRFPQTRPPDLAYL